MALASGTLDPEGIEEAIEPDQLTWWTAFFLADIQLRRIDILHDEPTEELTPEDKIEQQLQQVLSRSYGHNRNASG